MIRRRMVETTGKRPAEPRPMLLSQGRCAAVVAKDAGVQGGVSFLDRKLLHRRR